jgi:acetylornithine deacetylase/succinyl-diaminopimelate desuccinylase-like protein
MQKNQPFPDVVKLTQQFVRIETENGHEDRMGIVIEKLLKPFGFRFLRHELAPGRTNLFAIWEPNNSAQLILFSGHMDTVPGYEVNNSELAEIKDKKIFGRGTCDMKGGIAAFIVAALQFIEKFKKSMIDLKKGIILGFTVDEELTCKGVDILEDSSEIMELFKRISYCILAEPTVMGLYVAHKGINSYKVTFHGKAVHSSIPEQGTNAIYLAAEYIQKIQQYFQELQKIKTPLGTPKLSVGTINGGTATNIVPNMCEITIDRRYVPKEDTKKDELRFKKMAEDIDQSVQFESLGVGEAYFLPDGKKNPIVQELSSLLGNVPISFMAAYTEADIYHRKYKIPTIILGPGCQAHKTPEYVSVEQLHKAVEYYNRIINEYLLNT